MALTPESLIASLQQSLSHHATLLPALHAQLGLAPSALTMELEQLQSTLRDVVECQITKRRQEVDDWMGRCDGIERECLDLVACLGGHARTGQKSVGELRKVQVLPQRHEQLVSHKEQLCKLYNTKSEQLTTLINRAHNLSRTLGPSFFPPDVLNSHPPTTPETAQDDRLVELTIVLPPPSSPKTRIDVTPERFSRIEKEIMRGKAEITRRLSALSGALELVVWFYTELGITLPTPDVTNGGMLMMTGLESGSAAGRGLVAPSTSSTSVSTLASTAPSSGRIGHSPESYEQILARFVARWEEAEDEALEGDTLGVEGVDPTNGVMEWAERLKTELEELKAHRESQIQVIFDQLEVLWKRLGVDEGIIDAFVEQNRGSTEETVAAYQTELDRLLALKKESMSIFVSNAREEIVALWNDLILGEDERAEFTAFPIPADEHTEELLARHEEEITRLKEERLVKAPLLATINKYFEICDEERQLAESAADQSRLLGRGPRGDPGRLLREEKMRKRVKKEKPKLEHNLLQTIPAWEHQRNRPFLVNGVRVVDVLAESVEAEAGKENRKKPVSAPKTVPARATTPGPSTGTSTVPSTRKHAATPSSHSGPNKRQRVNTGSAVRPPSTTPMPNGSSGRVPFGTSNGNRQPSATSHAGSSKSGKGTPSNAYGGLVPPMPHLSKNAGHNLGLGLPSTGFQRPTALKVPSASTTSANRTVSGGARMAAVRKRESFRPRASIDSAVFGMGGMQNFGRLVAVGGARGGGVVEGLQEEDDEEDVF